MLNQSVEDKNHFEDMFIAELLKVCTEVRLLHSLTQAITCRYSWRLMHCKKIHRTK